MVFMRGAAPIRRTVNYLRAGKIVFRNNVKIFSINYHFHKENHRGTQDFVFWHLAQIQYKNPGVQVVEFKNLTPTPFIRCWLEDGSDVIMDLDSKTKEEIMEHLHKTLGKSEDVLKQEAVKMAENPAFFGWGCERHCICEIPGQVPCPAVVPLPKWMRGKYQNDPEFVK